MNALLNGDTGSGPKKKMDKKKQERKLIECLSCKKTKKHQARGLCSACYWTHSRRPFFESKWPLNVDVKYIDPLQKFKKVHPRVQSELDAISARFPKRPDPVRKRGECQRCLENVFIFCRGLCGKCYHFESTSDNFNKDWPSKRQQKQSNKKDSSKLIECKNCEKKQKHCARGLCSNCYFTERAQGGFEECKIYESEEAKRPRSSNNPLPMKQMLSVSVGKRRICLPKISKILRIVKRRGRPPMKSARRNKENVPVITSRVKRDNGRNLLTSQRNRQILSTSQLNREVNGESVQVKRGRGRPRKNPEPEQAEKVVQVKRGRGRPRKNPPPNPEPEQAEQNQQIPLKRGRGRPKKVVINDEPANQQSSSLSVANPETTSSITSELQNVVSAKRPGRPPKISKDKSQRVKRTIPFSFRQTRSATLQRSLLKIQPELINLEEDEEVVIDEQLSSPRRQPTPRQTLRISVEQTPARRNLTSISEQEVQSNDQVQFDDPPPSSSLMQDTLQHDHFYGDHVASDNLQEDPPGEASEERPEQQASELGNLDEQIKQTFEEAREQLGQLLDQISDHLTSQILRNTSNRRTAPNRYSGVISTFENMIEIFKPIEERINRTTQQQQIECITLESDNDLD